MTDYYMDVGDLRRVINDLPDTAKVYYERIEDVYFNKHGWKVDKSITSGHTMPEDRVVYEYVRAFSAIEIDGDLYITAHY